MSPTDPALIAGLIALTAGLVTVFRKEWPKLDGRIVYLLVLLVAEGVAWLSLDLALGSRAIVLCGIKVAAGALALVTGVNAAIDRHAAGVGAAMAEAMPVAQPLVGALLSSVESADGAKAETKVAIAEAPKKAPSIPPVVTGLALGALALFVLACSAATERIVRDVTGAACEVVVQEEKLPDLCSSLEELEAASAAAIASKSAPGSAPPATLYQKVLAYRARHP